MSYAPRRIVTGHDAKGKSIVLSEDWPVQNHPMQGTAIGADFHEIWSDPSAIPELTPGVGTEPTARPFTIMPPSGHLLRILEVYPLSRGGHRTPMHRTRTLDYVVVLEGELVLILSDSEQILRTGDVVVQRGTDHAWENRSDRIARAAFFHLDARFAPDLLARLPDPLNVLS
jgi:Cupin domain